jgi:hypothetical protein
MDSCSDLLRCRGRSSSTSLVRLSAVHFSTICLVSQISDSRQLANVSWVASLRHNGAHACCVPRSQRRSCTWPVSYRKLGTP